MPTLTSPSIPKAMLANGRNSKGDLSSNKISENSKERALSVATMTSENDSTKSWDHHGGHRTSQIGGVMSETGDYRGNKQDSDIITGQQWFSFRETVTASYKHLTAEINHVNEHYIDSMSLESLIDYIEFERLTHMPPQGSRWDNVLRWAEFFALQISGYEFAVRSFLPESKMTAKLIWASCRALIHLGPENAEAIEIAFELFFKLGLSLSFFLRHHDFISKGMHIQNDAGIAFEIILKLVRDVCVEYNARIKAINAADIMIDFNLVFGRNIAAFYHRKNQVIDGIWTTALQDPKDIHRIRKWLSVQDSTTLSIVQKIGTRHCEYTCDWFQRNLLEFIRTDDNILAIYGPPGCGKTYLSSWLVERLQRPLGQRSYETLDFTIDPQMPKKSTNLAIAKSIALQLFNINIGDVEMTEALVKGHASSFASLNTVAIENHIWDAINIGLSHYKGKIVILIDGLEEARLGDKDNSNVCNRILSLAKHHDSVKAIFLARKVSHNSKDKLQEVSITADHIHHDLYHYCQSKFQGHNHFAEHSGKEQHEIIEKIVHKSAGNFLWVDLAVSLLKQESRDGFHKVLDQFAHGMSLRDLVIKISNKIDISNHQTKQMLSWLLVAQRPLRIEEIRGLQSIDTEKHLIVAKKHKTHEDILQDCGHVISIANGIVRFRHNIIRSYFLEIQKESKILQSRAAAETDFMIRLLAHCKFRLLDEYQPRFEGLPETEIERIFSKDHLIEYALRNWIHHFQESSFHKHTGSFEFSAQFKALFPNSVQSVLMEAYCWDHEYLPFESARLHTLAYRIRQEIFTEMHESVLQNLLVCGNLYRKAGNTVEAGNFYYKASRIGRTVLEKHSRVTMDITIAFLDISNISTFSTRTETAIRYEEILKFTIESLKYQYGKTSDIVIRYKKSLVEFYVSIHEETRAEEVRQELREILIIRHDSSSDEDISVSGGLDVILHKGKKHETLTQYDLSLFEIDIVSEEWDIHHISKTLKLALDLEHRKEIFRAEEIYTLLWSQVIEHCQAIHFRMYGMEIHTSMIDVVIAYVRFLHRFHRHEEACSILICLWAEYEEYDFDSEVMFLRLRVIGEVMRLVGLKSTALSVFRKCMTWFRSHKIYEHVEICETLISETFEEIVTSTTTTTSTSTSTSTSTKSTTTTTTTKVQSERVMRETFETAITKSKTTSETVSVCVNLAKHYIELKQWSEAIKICTKSLEIIWKMIVSTGGTVALPKDFTFEAIQIAITLAMSHNHCHHFYEAEQIYIKIYCACLSSCHFDDERLIRSYTLLLTFYEEHCHWGKMIDVYREILTASRKHYGQSHKKTIEILYTIGRLCEKHGHSNAHEYYEEIIIVLNGKSHECHADAVNALISISRYYFEFGHWQKLRTTCELLWHTWTAGHHRHYFTTDVIHSLYIKYIYVLEYHIHAGYDVIRALALQYHQTCVKIFGAHVDITIKALIELAEISIRSEKHIHEAISYYEEVVRITKTTSTTTTISTTTVSTVERKLSEAYVHVCSHGSITASMTEQAIRVLSERFEHLKITYGCAHVETLEVFQELLFLCYKSSSKEFTKTVKQMLLDITITIISTETHSQTLHEAAKSLGKMYVSCGLIDEGRALIRELRTSIICKMWRPKVHSGFKLDVAVGKSSYIFIVTLEQIFQGTVTISHARIMSQLLIEVSLYEGYARCIKDSSNKEHILRAGARLYVFLIKNSHHEQATILCTELFEVFKNEWCSKLKDNGTTKIFFIGLLSELDKSRGQISLGRSACVASNDIVNELIDKHDFRNAYGVAHYAFHFIEHQRAYHHLENISFAFKLSGLMAGRGKDFSKLEDGELRSKMLELSRTIVHDIFKICREHKINFVQLKLEEINNLVALLGEQQNYIDLEWLLECLWSSREVQKNWSSDIIIAIGRRLVQARFLRDAHCHPAAMRLADTLCYNLRRVGDGLTPDALSVANILSQMYTTTEQYSKAMEVHEKILALIVEADDTDDKSINHVSIAVVKHHLEMLRRCYQRLGKWDKKQSIYHDLVHRLTHISWCREPLHQFPSIDTWSRKGKDDKVGNFEVPKNWELIVADRTAHEGDLVNRRDSHAHHSRPERIRRVTSNWGMESVYQNLFEPASAGNSPPLPQSEKWLLI